jgi:hypothetical protein
MRRAHDVDSAPIPQPRPVNAGDRPRSHAATIILVRQKNPWATSGSGTAFYERDSELVHVILAPGALIALERGWQLRVG